MNTPNIHTIHKDIHSRVEYLRGFEWGRTEEEDNELKSLEILLLHIAYLRSIFPDNLAHAGDK